MLNEIILIILKKTNNVTALINNKHNVKIKNTLFKVNNISILEINNIKGGIEPNVKNPIIKCHPNIG